MLIRYANEPDIPGILTLLRQVCNVHHAIRPDIFRPDAMKYDAPALSALLADPSRPIFVAVEGEPVLGYCFCALRDYRGGNGVSTDRIDLYIDDLCVEETCRGQGVATALYRHVAAYARSLGCTFITLNIWCGNETALHFYEHMGLTPRNITMEMCLEEENAESK